MKQTIEDALVLLAFVGICILAGCVVQLAKEMI
jgi:hypothetical protein